MYINNGSLRLHYPHTLSCSRADNSKTDAAELANTEADLWEVAKLTKPNQPRAIPEQKLGGRSLTGHVESFGNFSQLLELRASDCPELERWLKRKESFTSHEAQNEILELLSHEVIRDITAEVV